jgi:hypothetical protein
MRREWKLFSSFTDDGAVEIRWASTDIGDLGEGYDEARLVEYGLTGMVLE